MADNTRDQTNGFTTRMVAKEGQAPNTSLPTCTAFVDDRIVTLIIPVVVVAFVEAVVSVCVCRCDAVV